MGKNSQALAAPAPTPEAAPEAAPETPTRDLASQVATVSDPRARFALAPALDGSPGQWHKTPDGGSIAITRATVRETVRDYATYIPPQGKVAGIPLYALDAHPEIAV